MWTLLNNGIEKTAAEWGVEESSIQLSLGNQIADTLELTFANLPFDADIPFAFDSLVTLKRSGVAVFQGRVMTTPRAGEPRSESISLTIHGPWEELEQTIFEQIWKTNGGSAEARISRVIMGQTLAGGRQDTSSCVEEIFNYATLCGLNIQLGTNMAALSIPLSEVREQTLASLLRRYLSWQPSAATMIDYSTTPPTLNIIDRPAAAVVPLAIDGMRVSSVQITPRHDLVVPGVIIRYITTSVYEGSVVVTPTTDDYPVGVNPLNRRVLKASFDLDGGGISTSTQEQKIKTMGLPTVWEGDSGLWWWKYKLPFLYYCTDITVKFVTETSNGAAANSDEYPNEIIEGQWQKWMETSVTPSIKAKPFTVTAKISYTSTDEDTSAVNKKTETYSVNFLATTAATGTYKKKETSYTTGELPPSNLAEAYYNSISELQYDGSIVLKEQEAMATPIQPGMVVNLSGGRAEWTTMRAQIQQVAIKLGTGETTITVGPSKHLGLDTLMQLNQPARIQVQPNNDVARASGKAKKENGKTDGAEAAPGEGGIAGASIYKKQTLADKDKPDQKIESDVTLARFQIVGESGREIRLYTADLPEGKAASFRAVKFCNDGTEVTGYVLMTDPE